MKKLLLLVLLVFTTTSVFAASIGIKGGYSKMYDDYADTMDDTWNIGIYFDLGTFLFRTLQFRPGIDYLSLENEDTNVEYADVYGIHLDWYWFFMGKKSFSPFLGFGPALNYYSFEDESSEGDSDAGIEGFAGVEFDLTGPWKLLLELRYLWHDIADRDKTVVKLNAGIMHNF